MANVCAAPRKNCSWRPKTSITLATALSEWKINSGQSDYDLSCKCCVPDLLVWSAQHESCLVGPQALICVNRQLLLSARLHLSPPPPPQVSRNNALQESCVVQLTLVPAMEGARQMKVKPT